MAATPDDFVINQWSGDELIAGFTNGGDQLDLAAFGIDFVGSLKAG